jgi:hypothetical protein
MVGIEQTLGKRGEFRARELHGFVVARKENCMAKPSSMSSIDPKLLDQLVLCQYPETVMISQGLIMTLQKPLAKRTLHLQSRTHLIHPDRAGRPNLTRGQDAESKA